MIEILDKESGAFLGEITEQQLEFLIDQLEEESDEDTDYYLNPATLEMLEENGADPPLLELLRSAMGDRDEAEIQWSRRS